MQAGVNGRLKRLTGLVMQQASLSSAGGATAKDGGSVHVYLEGSML